MTIKPGHRNQWDITLDSVLISHWLGCLNDISQMYLLLDPAYPLARCLFGYSLAMEWISSWLLRTKVADINSFLLALNILVVKLLLILRLRAIWNKRFHWWESQKHGPMDSLCWFFWTPVTLILYFMTAGMFCRIWFLIDRRLTVEISWGAGRLWRQCNT